MHRDARVVVAYVVVVFVAANRAVRRQALLALGYCGLDLVSSELKHLRELVCDLRGRGWNDVWSKLGARCCRLMGLGGVELALETANLVVARRQELVLRDQVTLELVDNIAVHLRLLDAIVKVGVKATNGLVLGLDRRFVKELGAAGGHLGHGKLAQ